MTSNKNKETRRHNAKKTQKLRIPRSKYMKRSGAFKKEATYQCTRALCSNNTHTQG